MGQVVETAEMAMQIATEHGRFLNLSGFNVWSARMAEDSETGRMKWVVTLEFDDDDVPFAHIYVDAESGEPVSSLSL